MGFYPARAWKCLSFLQYFLVVLISSLFWNSGILLCSAISLHILAATLTAFGAVPPGFLLHPINGNQCANELVNELVINAQWRLMERVFQPFSTCEHANWKFQLPCTACHAPCLSAPLLWRITELLQLLLLFFLCCLCIFRVTHDAANCQPETELIIGATESGF